MKSSLKNARCVLWRLGRNCSRFVLLNKRNDYIRRCWCSDGRHWRVNLSCNHDDGDAVRKSKIESCDERNQELRNSIFAPRQSYLSNSSKNFLAHIKIQHQFLMLQQPHRQKDWLKPTNFNHKFHFIAKLKNYNVLYKANFIEKDRFLQKPVFFVVYPL